MALFPQPQIPQNSLLMRAQSIRQLMGGDPQAFAVQMMQSNPQLLQQFDNFMQLNKGKTQAQVLRDNGIDPSTLGISDS